MSYSAYRPIDELWLTTIPKHWDSRKIKYAFSERIEKGYPDEPLLVASQNMGVVPKGVYGNRTVEAMKDLHNLKLVRVGDFVISLRSFQGGIEYAYYQGIISPAYTIMIPNSNITSGYFRYLAKSRLFLELLQMCVTGIREGQNIDYAKLKNHLIPLPPRNEQDQIVRFLDWKVSRINKLINAKRKQIELLMEHKLVVISRAIKGDFIKIKHIGRIQGRIGFKGYSANDLVTSDTKGCAVVLGGTNIMRNGTMDYSKLTYLSEYKYFESPEIMLNGNEILITKVGAGVGESGIYDGRFERTTINPNVMILFTNNNQNTKYINYALTSDSIRTEIKLESAKSGAQPAINQGFIKTLSIPLPSFNEQQVIVAYLNKQCEHTDNLIDKLNDEITLFIEYRTRLISDVVVGKLDVRGVAVPNYETIEEVASTSVAEEENTLTTECEDTAISTKIIEFPIVAAKAKGHNQHFDDAVMIAGIVNTFYSEKYPLGRKKIQKLLYLLRRYQEESIATFKKKAAGPYADVIRYKGGEPIAEDNKYIVTATTEKGTTFARGEKISQALEYIEKWNMQTYIQWLVDKFHYTKVDDLELLATVDMAICDLNGADIPVNVKSIKHLIATNKEWKAKLKKQTFSDGMIAKAINELENLLEGKK